ncbi:hypothetical protein JQ544_16575 [Bradyrhizobium diazoefficiens]|nr:hypothetical protein [Bradyrhizobium diazoefficiens]MBR0813151.1 hypothetical protein [Bradyrhizobium diazoefficiens]
MAKERKLHQYVSFADSHRNTIFPTFNAYTALGRAEDLLDDARHLALVYDAAGDKAGRGRLQGFNITDYYLVGYVTCLEWHARSRLADVLTFDPKLIESREVRSVDAEAISQMPEVRVTLADLLGVSAKVNNLEDYLRIFERLWKALEIAVPLKVLIAGSSELAGGSRYLYEMFSRRHSLVHEVGMAQVGSYLLRDTWTFDDAIAHGEMTVDLIKKIEFAISEVAPDNFPNKLGSDGYPESPIAKLDRRIGELEARVAAAAPSKSAADFAKGTESASEYLTLQEFVVDSVLRDVPKRHYDPRAAILEILRRHRLEFLIALGEELGVEGGKR